jgi:GT2 family glycosyltransferase
MKSSVVIPTYKRPQSLLATVVSISSNTTLPTELIIVDDDCLTVDQIKEIQSVCTSNNISLVYHKKDHTVESRGSATSRNIGIARASYNITFIFDDDILLEPEFISSVLTIWQANTDKQLLAVGGVIINNRIPNRFEQVYHKLFGLGNMSRWDVNTIGFQSWTDDIKENIKGFYAHGGVCSYDTAAVKALGLFATFTGGRTALEDVEFFLRAKNNGYNTIVTPHARAHHDHSPLGRENNYLAGQKEGFNRVLLFKLHAPKGFGYWLWFTGAQIAWLLRKLFVLQFSYASGVFVGSVLANIKKYN